MLKIVQAAFLCSVIASPAYADVILTFAYGTCVNGQCGGRAYVDGTIDIAEDANGNYATATGIIAGNNLPQPIGFAELYVGFANGVQGNFWNISNDDFLGGDFNYSELVGGLPWSFTLQDNPITICKC